MTSADSQPKPADVAVAAAPQDEPAQLTQQQRRIYGRLGTRMDQFHNHFRQTWSALYAAVSPDASDGGTKPLPARRLIDLGLSFTEQLTMHHTIEETYVFPLLAKKMPSFRPDAFAYTQHKAIHEGIDRLEAHLRAMRKGERELRREEVKEIMDGFGDVLWQHLDEEVKELSAENMAKFWTLEEMQRIPI